MSESHRNNDPDSSSRIYLRLAPGDIAILKFLLEAHDNLAYLITVSPYSAVVGLVFAPEQEDEVRVFLESARAETPWIEVWTAGGKRQAGRGN